MEIAFDVSVKEPVVAPNFSSFASWSGGRIFVVEIDSGEIRSEISIPDQANARIAWDRTSSVIAIGFRGGHVSIYDRDGSLKGSVELNEVVHAIDFEWDGRRIAVSAMENVHVIDLATMATVEVIAHPRGWGERACWTSRGDLWTIPGRSIEIRNLAEATVRKVNAKQGALLNILAHHDFVITTSENKDPVIWSNDGDEVTRLDRPEDWADYAIWNETEVGCWDSELRVWSIPDWDLKVSDIEVPMDCAGFIPRSGGWLMIRRPEPNILTWGPIED